MQFQLSDVDYSCANVRLYTVLCRSEANTYVVTSFWLPKTNVLRGQAYDITGVTDDTSSRAPCAHINEKKSNKQSMNKVGVTIVLYAGRHFSNS
jgi:hypothetical protein